MKKYVDIRTRYAEHTSGTKWYRVSLLTISDGKSKATKLVSTWGGMGKSGQAQIKAFVSISDYSNRITKKMKMKAGEWYRFEEEVYERIDATGDLKAYNALMGMTGWSSVSKLDRLREELKAVLHAEKNLSVSVNSGASGFNKGAIKEKSAQDFANSWGIFA